MKNYEKKKSCLKATAGERGRYNLYHGIIKI